MKRIITNIMLFIVFLLLSTLVLLSGYYLANNDNKYENKQNDLCDAEILHNEDNADTIQNMSNFDTAFVDNMISNVNGSVQWGVHTYNNDFEYKSASFPVPSASVIKVFIMEYAYDCILNGSVTADTMIGSSTLYDLMYLMITQSDNDCTNQLIDYFGMENLNSYFAQMGYNDTSLQRRMLDFEAQKNGKENFTSIDDVMKFLDKLYQNKDISPYCDMMTIMLGQQRKNKIPEGLPVGTKVANKTGELSDVENDIAIVFDQKGDFAVAFLMTSLSDVDTAKETIRQCTKYIYENN